MAPPVQHIVTAEVDASAVEQLAGLVEDIDPVQLERPGHDRVWLEWYVASESAARALLARVRRQPGVAGAGRRRFTARDWNALWQKQVRGGAVGQSLYLSPSWEKRLRPAAAGRRIVRLDPGLGFGTGEHFTTRFCLEKLEYLCQKFAPRSALDVGTGSGILAVAAARLGCRRVLGFDNDPQAVANARKNVALNRMGRRVRLEVGEAQACLARGRFDVVCANLFAPLLIELAPALVRCASPWLVLSGLREFEVDGVAEIFRNLGADEQARDGDGEWAGLMMRVEKRTT